MAEQLKKFYRRFLSFPLLDSAIKGILEFFTDIFSAWRDFSFPDNYIRKWKWDMLLGRYESETVSLVKKVVKPGMVVVDIGAHVGYFTRIFSKLTGRTGQVHAFEADPQIFSILKKNTRRFKNARLYQVAVTDKSGAMDFYHSEEKSGCGSTLVAPPVEFKRRKIEVPADKLDLIFAKESITKVDFIKMDIEGGEPAALRGMRGILEKNRDISLIIEFNPDWLKAGGVVPLLFLKELREFGFDVFAILNDKIIPFNPKDEQETKKILTPYGQTSGFMNIYCRRPRSHLSQ